MTPPPDHKAPVDDTDYAHRNRVNLIAVIFLLVLGIAVMFVVNLIDERRKLERCVNANRRDCFTLPSTPGTYTPVR